MEGFMDPQKTTLDTVLIMDSVALASPCNTPQSQPFRWILISFQIYVNIYRGHD